MFLLFFILLAPTYILPLVVGNSTSGSFKDSIFDYIGLTATQLIEKFGYVAETHSNISTPDGYLLDLHRIPHGQKNSNEDKKPVVLLMHGLLSSSADWVNYGPSFGLPYILADEGFDVWMGNVRGNVWSRKHVKYNPDIDRKKYWDFGIDELAEFDLPTIIDYVLHTTNQKQLYYVGHSQGTAIFYMLCSMRPEYNDKIKLMVSLAPAAKLVHLKSPIFKIIVTLDEQLKWIREVLGFYEFLPHSSFFTIAGKWFCNEYSPFLGICASVFELWAGPTTHLNKTLIPIISSNAPAGCSTKQIIQITQVAKSGHFRKYDYGPEENSIRYGQKKPPEYNINQITAPVALMYAKNDSITVVEDVEDIIGQLPNVVYHHLVEADGFNHIDFIWAKDIVPLVQRRVLKLLTQHEKL